MRLVLCTLGAVMVASTPALADAARVEIQGGVDWGTGRPTDAVIGAAAGYDWSLPGGAFVGAEESVDKPVGTDRHVRWGSSGRLGLHIDPQDKLYGTAGYNYGVGPHATDLGAGWEHSIGKIYGKVEYKHYFTQDGYRDSNGALLGAGVHF